MKIEKTISEAVTLPGCLSCMGTPPSFSTILTKGNKFYDFLFASLKYNSPI